MKKYVTKILLSHPVSICICNCCASRSACGVRKKIVEMASSKRLSVYHCHQQRNQDIARKTEPFVTYCCPSVTQSIKITGHALGLLLGSPFVGCPRSVKSCINKSLNLSGWLCPSYATAESRARKTKKREACVFGQFKAWCNNVRTNVASIVASFMPERQQLGRRLTNAWVGGSKHFVVCRTSTAVKV